MFVQVLTEEADPRLWTFFFWLVFHSFNSTLFTILCIPHLLIIPELKVNTNYIFSPKPRRRQPKYSAQNRKHVQVEFLEFDPSQLASEGLQKGLQEVENGDNFAINS